MVAPPFYNTLYGINDMLPNVTYNVAVFGVRCYTCECYETSRVLRTKVLRFEDKRVFSFNIMVVPPLYNTLYGINDMLPNVVVFGVRR